MSTWTRLLTNYSFSSGLDQKTSWHPDQNKLFHFTIFLLSKSCCSPAPKHWVNESLNEKKNAKVKGHLTLNGKKRYQNPDVSMSFPVNIVSLFTNEKHRFLLPQQCKVLWIDWTCIELRFCLFVCLFNWHNNELVTGNHYLN